MEDRIIFNPEDVENASREELCLKLRTNPMLMHEVETQGQIEALVNILVDRGLFSIEEFTEAFDAAVDDIINHLIDNYLNYKEKNEE